MSDDDDYFDHARKVTIPKMSESLMSVTILTSGVPDPKMCLQVGAAVLLDKPLIVVVLKGTPVPANLKRVASVILETDEAGSEKLGDQLQAAIKSVLENDKRRKRSPM